MNLREEILKEHSKVQCNRIVQWVGNDQKRFDELFRLFLNEEYQVTQRASWPVCYCITAQPSFINKNWNKLIRNLQKPNLHDAVKRHSIRLLQDIKIPKKYEGEIMNTCFKYLESPTEALAIKVFSMTVLANLAAKYPEIVPELKLLIESQLADQTAGFKSRANKILKKFSK